jgi:RNA polymerase sigma factor (sigma-70 family)
MSNTDKIIETAVNKAIEILRQKNMIKLPLNSYQKTELLLRNYKHFKDIIINKDKKIAEIRAEGIVKKGHPGEIKGSFTYVSELERIEDKIERFERKLIKMIDSIEMLEKALEKIKKDDYYEIIELYYFENKSRMEISEELCVDPATVSRNRKRLIDILKTDIFPDDFLDEIVG